MRPNLEKLIGGSMKINQVEELVGITKKNIRFYEEQGLITPERNLENGYRNYTLSDVEKLNRIKLLRKLDVPIDMIRQLEEGKISIQECMDAHITKMNHRQHELDVVKEMCQIIAREESDMMEMNANKYLEDMQHMREGETIFMDVEKYDVRKSKREPIIAAVGCISIFLFISIIVLHAYLVDSDMPIGFLIYMLLILAALIIGVSVALKLRLHEIEGGEINEARKY